jgi:hypothetical protein
MPRPATVASCYRGTAGATPTFGISGEREIPQGIAILVRLVRAGKVSLADIEARRDY